MNVTRVLSKKNTIRGVLIFSFIIFWALIIKANSHRVGSFAFFDEYSTYVTGYFMIKGRHLFTDIFLNHQLLLSYISYYLQLLLKPESFYMLVVQHRMFIVIASLIFSALLVMRFRWIGMLYSILIELTKFYLFGSLFLAESLIIYPLAYMVISLIIGAQKEYKIHAFDFFIAACITWFVIFMREPYAPVALVHFVFFMTMKERIKTKVIAASLLFGLTGATMATVPFSEYYYQLVTINATAVAGSELEESGFLGSGLLKIFLYPIYIFLSGEENFFRLILVLLSILFLFLFIWFVHKKRQYKTAFFLFIVLGLANIRLVEPGKIYYVAFHMLVWMSLFIASIATLLELYRKNATWRNMLPLYGVLGAVICIGIFNPNSFVLERVNKEIEFNDNYIRFSRNGQLIRTLADTDDRAFVDVSDSLVYYYSGLDSSYKYAFYYPVMSSSELFKNERLKMFQESPPEFYYYNCQELGPGKNMLPGNITKQYRELIREGDPTCLFIHQKKIKNMHQEKLEEMNKLNYTIL